MKKFKHITQEIFSFFFLTVLVTSFIAQDYSIESLNLSKLKESVHSPHLIDGKLYFSSDVKTKAYKSFKNQDGLNFHDLYRVKIDRAQIKGKIQRLPDGVNTILSDGPITFDQKESKLYYTSTQNSEEKFSTIGIFISKLKNDTFSKPEGFIYNNTSYNVAHPCLSEDGNLLIFASDMPGGVGKSDLYFCRLKNGKWTTPKSLGDSINTIFKENFPYLYKNQLYFSSDREGGIGKLDIYRSFLTTNGWTTPKLLSSPINTEANDFSIFLINGIQEGYLSSDRGELRKDKILYFKTTITEPLDYVEVDPIFCYDFKDEKFSDLKDVTYEWEFGDGQKEIGNPVNHCFDRLGSYSVSLNITDNYIDYTYKNLYTDTLVISTQNNLPYIVCESFNDRYDFSIDLNSCNVIYDHFYWLVDGVIHKDEKISLPKTTEEVKYVTWQNDKLDQVVGVKRRVIQ